MGERHNMGERDNAGVRETASERQRGEGMGERQRAIA